ncbi:hypothetical protein DY000_02040918 [Brassica cretica]|uniref:Uncharacterized protein n=1 Tax=Brassica cretica TaxID=69181 RepID=A0ABQ7BK39_BRACR|nr:hypothetical protein DY000_02040918 [Brassica cretica]
MIKMDHEKTKSRSGNRPRDVVRLNNMKRASWTSDETAGRCKNEARSAGRSSDKLSVAHIKFGQLSNHSSIEFSSEKGPSYGIVPNDSKIRVLVHDSRTQASKAVKGLQAPWIKVMIDPTRRVVVLIDLIDYKTGWMGVMMMISDRIGC